jgi:hypothetical protein
MLNGLLEVISSSPDLAAGAVQVGDEVLEGKNDLPSLIDELRSCCHDFLGF